MFFKIKCIFCEDDKKHLALSPNKGTYYCFNCHQCGTLDELVGKLGHVNE